MCSESVVKNIHALIKKYLLDKNANHQLSLQ